MSEAERTVTELIVLQAIAWGPNREFTVKEMQDALSKPGKTTHITGPLAALYHAGVVDRRYVPKLAGYRYRWLGAGPGGVR